MARTYTEEQKRLAVAAYVATGTLAGAAKICKIPRQTIQGWRKTNPSWWERIASEVWASEEDKIRAKYSQIVDKATDALLDRIENGDTRVNAKGEYKVPVAARDLMIIAGVSQDKLNLSLGKPTSISTRAELNSSVDKLAALKKAGRAALEKVVSIED